jgi:hypothetical protein
MARLGHVRISDSALWRMMLAPGHRGPTQMRLLFEQWGAAQEGSGAAYADVDLDAERIEVRSTYYDHARRHVVYVIEHPDLPECSDGCEPVTVRPVCHFHTDTMPAERMIGARLRDGSVVTIAPPVMATPNARARHLRMLTLDTGQEEDA